MTQAGEGAAAAVGAALGATVWQVLVLVTRAPEVRVTTVLVMTLCCAAVIGFLSGRITNSVGALVLWGAAGTASAPVLIVAFAMMQRPLWFLTFVVLYPLIVTAGYAGGRAAARGWPV